MGRPNHLFSRLGRSPQIPNPLVRRPQVLGLTVHALEAPYWVQTVTTIGLAPPPPRLPLSVPGMVAVLPGAAGTVPEVLVCVRLNSPPSTVLCQLTAPS